MNMYVMLGVKLSAWYMLGKKLTPSYTLSSPRGAHLLPKTVYVSRILCKRLPESAGLCRCLRDNEAVSLPALSMTNAANYRLSTCEMHVMNE